MQVPAPPVPTREFLQSLREISRACFGGDDPPDQALPTAVRKVSERYTRSRDEVALTATDGSALAARLRFFLPRDLFKLWGPLSELTAVDALPRRKTLRVLDVGAGLGTTTLALASHAAAEGWTRRIAVTAIDRDRQALSVMRRVVAKARGLPRVPVELTTLPARISAAADVPADGELDVVVLGLCLNELLTPLPHADVAEAAGEALLRGLAGRLASDGVLIVLEPALRPQARTLAALRDRLVQAGGPPFVFAPCVGAHSCPMLARPRDWCHERVPWPLPAALAEVASAAGLRRQDLSYSYLTLHARRRSVAELAPASADAMRVVSAPLVSKGKLELSLCGPGGGLRLMSLDRHRGNNPDVLRRIGRGTVLALSGGDIEADPRGARARLRPNHLPRVLRRY